MENTVDVIAALLPVFFWENSLQKSDCKENRIVMAATSKAVMKTPPFVRINRRYYTITLGVLPFGARRDGKLRFPRYYTINPVRVTRFHKAPKKNFP